MSDLVERLRRRTFRPTRDMVQALEEQGNLTNGDARLHEDAAAEIERLRKDAEKSERRAITFGDCLSHQILAMRAAVVAGHLESPAHGMQWIVNTLEGPGHLPDLDEARALGGAQALFDKEMAEHEAFRAAHPAPGAALHPQRSGA